VIQLVLQIHVCADPAPTEYVATIESAPIESAAGPASVESVADPAPAEFAAAKSAAEPLHSFADYAADSAAASAALTETS
jgi:hypothetical protein